MRMRNILDGLSQSGGLVNLPPLPPLLNGGRQTLLPPFRRGGRGGRSYSSTRHLAIHRLLQWFALALVVSAMGCNRQDAEKLARVGWKLAEKVQRIIPDRLPFGSWPGTADTSVEGRVRARIMSDRYLAPLNIEVIATMGGVRLHGTVEDDVLKRRALEMAESTVGVEKVVDELQ